MIIHVITQVSLLNSPRQNKKECSRILNCDVTPAGNKALRRSSLTALPGGMGGGESGKKGKSLEIRTI